MSDREATVSQRDPARTDKHQCWRCGRPLVHQYWGERFVFGPVCDRANCKRVKQGLSKAHQNYWFRIGLPDADSLGRAGSYTVKGERR